MPSSNLGIISNFKYYGFFQFQEKQTIIHPVNYFKIIKMKNIFNT